MSAALICLFLTSGVLAVDVPLGPVVRAESGQYRGLPANPMGAVRYFGIPFAKPPIGDLRFKPTELISPHSGVFEATHLNSVCPQLNADLAEKLESMWGENFSQSEDCLYLDVYVPPAASVENPKAVLVWIHGGSYIIGCKHTYDGSLLAGLNDVIVVTINYRLGILGFLSTMDAHAPGNAGLHDQIVALQWVRENIGGFGGDRNRVTICGESAGGGSVTQLTVSPLSHGLFHRVIAQSGSPLAPWSHVADPLPQANTVAHGVGCPSNNSKDLVDCLRRVPYKDFLQFQEIDPTFTGPKWAPVYHNEFFPFTLSELKHSLETLSIKDQLLRTDLMIGVCSEEGAYFYSGLEKFMQERYGIPPGQAMGPELFKTMASPLAEFMALGDGVIDDSWSLISHRYTDWQEPDSAIGRAKMYVQFISDTMFNVAAADFVRSHAGIVEAFNATGSESPGGGTFFYRFNQPGSWMTTSAWRTGSDHGDDDVFLFGAALTDTVNATEEEKFFTRKMMRYWTNFVKTGDPNEPMENFPLPKWPRYDLQSETFMELDTNLSADSAKTRMFPERIAFWTDLIPKHRRQLADLRDSFEDCLSADNDNNSTQL